MVKWDPWRELERRGHIRVVWRPLPEGTGGAAIVRQHGQAVVFLDPRLSGRERTAALAHELVHDERGLFMDTGELPPTWKVCVVREERRVDREVARRLVPLEELIDAARCADDFGYPVTAAEIAEEFGAPLWVAELAMEMVQHEPWATRSA